MMRSTCQQTSRAGALAIAAAGILLLPAIAGAQTPAAGRTTDLHQGRRADPSALVRDLSSAGRNGADVADDLRGCAAVGARHQDAHRRARDAAVPHRQDHRHHVVQERSVADRRRDRDDRHVGRCRRAARQSGRHAAAAAVRRHQRVAVRRPTSSSSSRPTRCRRPDPICTATSTPTFRSPRTATSRRFRPAPRRRARARSCTTRSSYAVDDPTTRT